MMCEVCGGGCPAVVDGDSESLQSGQSMSD